VGGAAGADRVNRNMQANTTPRSLLKRVLRPVYHPPRAAFQYLRARRIVRDYASNYRSSQEAYRAAGHPDTRALPALDRLGVRIVRPGETDGIIAPPPAYGALVDRVAADVARRFEQSANCLFMPRVPREGLPAVTADVPAVRDRDVISLQMIGAAAVAGVAELSDVLMPEIERRVFGSWVIVDKVYVYRNLVTRQQEQVSWLWHYDNHPTEVVKIMIYLTDVGERNAPFEFVRKKDTGEPLGFTPRPLLGNSRVAASKVDELLRDGYEVVKATGPRGTMVLFDDNVLHRATFAREGLRDALVYQVRPATFRPEPRLDPRWSGSFEHVDFNLRPDDYAVHPKRHRFSG
jgi:hypothetical protein